MQDAYQQIRKHPQRQIDRRRVQRVNGVFQIQPQVLANVKTSGLWNQAQGQRLPEPPIPPFVGIGQSRFGNGFPKTQMVKRLVFGVEIFDDIAQGIAPRQLSEDHTNQLLAHSEMLHPRVGIVKCVANLAKVLRSIKYKNLRMNKAFSMHRCEQAVGIPKKSNS